VVCASINTWQKPNADERCVRRAETFRTHSTTAFCGLLVTIFMSTPIAEELGDAQAIEQRITDLLGEMTLAEKIGQMSQLNASGGNPVHDLGDRLRAGHIGSVINQVDVDTVNELQRIAVEESRLGIPLLVGRDVIHGFKTVLPIPLGQAASWNPELVREGARVAANEAATTGVGVELRRAWVRTRIWQANWASPWCVDFKAMT